jgi:class 3 adenylate cyclase
VADTPVVDVPETRYATSGDVSIAYQVTGDGPYDLVWVQGFISHVELAWDNPAHAALNRRLSSFCRLIRFDKRGTGMSDRVAVGDLETRMDDVRAVMDAVGSSQAALFGSSEGGPMSILFAATYPERVWALALWSTFPRWRWAPDYEIGLTDEQVRQEVEEEMQIWADPGAAEKAARQTAPGFDNASIAAFARTLRQGASPGSARALIEMSNAIDVRQALPAIGAPTLAAVRSGDDDFNRKGTRYIAERIPGARYVELPGAAHAPAAGDQQAFITLLQSFLDEARDRRQEVVDIDRVLATVLFTDIVGSTKKMAELGDRGWRDLIQQHHGIVRRELQRYHGNEIDTAGDGFFARFDGPARAIRCATTIAEQVGPLGIEVRAGVHTGECELADGKVAGIAVSIGARVAAAAAPDEVLVSNTVKDLVAGSGLRFEDRGVHELKGVPGEWQLWAVATNP